METMKKLLLCFVITLALVATSSLAGPLAITFEGDSTLHRFSGIAKEHNAEINAGANGNSTVLVTIPVKSLDTDHEGRDEKMREMFDADHFPEIRGVADLASVVDVQKDHVPVELTIRDQTRTIEARKIHDPADPAGSIRLAWTVSLASFGLKAPTVIGLIRVYDEVKVSGVFPSELFKSHQAASAESQ